MNDKELFVNCECHTHGLLLSIYGDKVIREFSIHEWYLADHGNAIMNFVSRIKAAWGVLIKGRWSTHHSFLIDHPETAQEIIDFLNLYISECSPKQYRSIK